jgi:hypothetical protein
MRFETLVSVGYEYKRWPYNSLRVNLAAAPLIFNDRAGLLQKSKHLSPVVAILVARGNHKAHREYVIATCKH